MIAKASSVAHGYNAINYVTTKKDAVFLKSNHLSEGRDGVLLSSLNPDGIWEEMKIRKDQKSNHKGKKLKNDVIRIEIAPSEEEAATLKTPDDWQNLLQEWMLEMERICNKRDKKGKPKSLDFSNSQYIAMCHYDSGKPHIHLVVNRVRENGEVNSDHNIGRNATKAANAVNEKRGWTQSEQIHDEKVESIYNSAMEILSSMEKFNWGEYARKMKEKGYTLSLKRDSEGKVRSYRVISGNSSYKASEIGAGKKLTAGHIFTTWLKLHPEAGYNNKEKKQDKKDVSPKKNKQGSNTYQTVKEHQNAIIAGGDYKLFDFDTDEGKKSIAIPENIFREIDKTAYDTNDDNETVADLNREVYPMAASLWCAAAITGNAVAEYLDMATQISEGGGGGGGVHGELSSWGKDPNEDLFALARRAGRTASSALTSRSGRSRGRRR